MVQISNLVMWNLIVGFLVPNLIAVIQQPKFSEGARAMVTALVSIAGGLGTTYFSDQFNLGDIAGSILVVGVASISFYKGFWKPTGVAPAIESKTSVGGNRNEAGAYDPLYLVVLAIFVVILIWLLFHFVR